MKKFILLNLLLSFFIFESANAATLTVTNQTSLEHCPLKVIQEGKELGTIPKGQTSTYPVDLSAQVAIQIVDYSWGTTTCGYGLSSGSVGLQNNSTTVGQGTSASGHSFCQTVTMTDNSGKTINLDNGNKVCDGASTSGTGGEYNVATTVTGS